MKTNKVAVVVPYYNSILNEYEIISYRQCIRKLYNYPIVFVVPEDMPEKCYPKDDRIQILKVHSEWLQSRESYNRMMMNVEFYRLFETYEYILIYQFDALVFDDKLEYFCGLGFDYIGAPWLHGMISLEHLEHGVKYVGNGGFSLRRINKFIEILDNLSLDASSWTEDVFWSNCESESFKVAPIDVALTFSFETQVKRCYKLNNYRIPFGCHAWVKYDMDFWTDYLLSENPAIEIPSGYNSNLDKSNDYTNRKFINASPKIFERWLSRRDIKCMYIFGVGSMGKMCGWSIGNSNLIPCKYLDNNKKLWKQCFHGIPIDSPEILINNNTHKLIIIAVRDAHIVYKQLVELGIDIEHETITYVEFADEINALMEEYCDD